MFFCSDLRYYNRKKWPAIWGAWLQPWEKVHGWAKQTPQPRVAEPGTSLLSQWGLRWLRTLWKPQASSLLGSQKPGPLPSSEDWAHGRNTITLQSECSSKSSELIKTHTSKLTPGIQRFSKGLSVYRANKSVKIWLSDPHWMDRRGGQEGGRMVELFMQILK